MGSEVDSVAFLERLRRDVFGAARAISISRANIGEVLVGLASRKEALDFQSGALGVGVGGVVLIDPASKDIVPLFKSGPHSVLLPYVWKREQAKLSEDIVNAMFLSWRSRESLKMPLKDRFYPPEYVYYGDSYTQHGTVNKWDQSVRDFYRCHYVTLGETLFFLVTWRMLLRFTQSADDNLHEFLHQSFTQGQPLNGPGSTESNFWDTDLLGGSDSREAAWLEDVRLVPSLNPLWESVRSICDSKSSHVGFLSDLSALHLFMPDNPLEARNRTHVASLSNFLAQVCDNPGYRGSANPTDYADVVSLIGLLVDVACRTIFGVSSPANVVRDRVPQFLKRFHMCTRFPVIPYFYLWALDQVPRCHLTFPLWDVSSDFVEVAVHDQHETAYIPTYESAFLNPRIYKSTTVAYAVTGVEPIPEFDWTMSSIEIPRPNVFSERFALIRSYYDILARPLIDSLFYAFLKREQQRREFSEEINRIAGSKLHALKGRIANVSIRIKEFMQSPQCRSKENAKSIRQLLYLNEQARIRVARLVLLLASKRISLEKVDAIRSISEVIKCISELYACHITLEHDEHYQVLAKKEVIETTLEELLENSVTHAQTDIKVRLVRIQLHELKAVASEFAVDTDHSYILCEVIDKGPGIPYAEKKKIFEPGFSRKDSGLGLSITKEILDKNNIYIWEDGESGARFRFVLPEYQETSRGF